MVARWFRISFAENAFRRYLAEDGTVLDELRIPGALASVLGFYRAARAQHASIPDEGDGLLWQWGPDADAARFLGTFTRQLTREGDDQPVVLVTLALSYRWTPARREVGRGHVRCFDPEASGDFEREVRRSAAYRAIATAAPVEASLRTYTL